MDDSEMNGFCTHQKLCRGGLPTSQITKRALASSLKLLLLQKPLNKITINDIAEKCGVSRMTFYYHFKDVYDLVEWTCEEDVARALDGKKTYDTWQAGFLNIFRAVEDNKPFVLSVYRSVGRERVEQYLNPLVHNLILDVVEEKSSGMAISESDKKFIAKFYEYAFIGIMLEWIDNGMKEDAAAIVERTSQLVHGNVIRALNTFRVDKPLHSGGNV
ncbi:TetR/AcrR family transcriptional regulator [Faecalibaculum rodentium]|uniref:TetR/AcrR family transcriptional regulator n=1 Tax=Faecalibaculum rodentium TaxID=1702221 RepID=UPI00272B65C5|nr:TetR/AcrR family transcriptional regulator [Faecalibaculum rodentium]